jgi:hypothetical protein
LVCLGLIGFGLGKAVDRGLERRSDGIQQLGRFPSFCLHQYCHLALKLLA